MKNKLRRERSINRYYHNREEREAMRRTLAFKLSIFAIRLDIFFWKILSVVLKKVGTSKITKPQIKLVLEALPRLKGWYIK